MDLKNVVVPPGYAVRPDGCIYPRSSVTDMAAALELRRRREAAREYSRVHPEEVCDVTAWKETDEG